ncbi:hypothetical protein IFR05_015525 [Cadophora sp. M221]|nr:hypothetical protein IFR05_015525 [Cadophora sp. M221]
MSSANFDPLESPFECTLCGYPQPRLSDGLLELPSESYLKLACPQCYPDGHWKLKRVAVHKPQPDPSNVYKDTEQSFEYRCEICKTQHWYTTYQRTSEDAGNITKDPDPPTHHCPTCFPPDMWELNDEKEIRKFGPRVERFTSDDPLLFFPGWKVRESMPYGNMDPIWWYLVQWPFDRGSDGRVLRAESFPFVTLSGSRVLSGSPRPNLTPRNTWKICNPGTAPPPDRLDPELPEPLRGTRGDPPDPVSRPNTSHDTVSVLYNGRMAGDGKVSTAISPTRRDWQTYNEWVEGRRPL